MAFATQALYEISTHTPLARRDWLVVQGSWIVQYFYSHASCEARLHFLLFPLRGFPFLLTRLLRGATINIVVVNHSVTFLLTRLLRGATEQAFRDAIDGAISTHTPLARRDGIVISANPISQISTHTPLARRDRMCSKLRSVILNFYSHASCEARPNDVLVADCNQDFYSHASCEARQLHIVYVTLAPPIYKKRTQNYNKIFYKIQYFA